MLSQAFNDMSSRVFASQQSQKDFVTNVSHELKTPITSIQGYAQAILDGTVLGEESFKQAATIIFNEANRMHGMVMDLLTLAKLETGIADMQMSLLDLRVLLDHLLEGLPFLLTESDRIGVQLFQSGTCYGRWGTNIEGLYQPPGKCVKIHTCWRSDFCFRSSIW